MALRLATLGAAVTAPCTAAAQHASREQTADQQIHHVLNRLAFGARPGDVEAIRVMGVDAWIDRQLYPERIPDATTEQFVARFPTLGKSGEQLLADAPPPAAMLAQLQRRGGTMTAADSARLREQGRQSYAFVGELASSRVARAVISERQLNEVMVDFWENHFNVFAGKDRTRYFLPEYDAQTIRPHALGTFRALLGAHAEQQPAPLLQDDVGGAVHQVVAVAVRDRRERLGAARRDDHPVGPDRSARNRRPHVVGRVHGGGQTLDLLPGVGRFMEECPGAPPADHEVRLDRRLAEPLQQADSVDDSGGAGDTDYQAHNH